MPFREEDIDADGPAEAMRAAWQKNRLFDDFGGELASLRSSVGKFSTNHRDDVAKVEGLLNKTGHLDLAHEDGPTGWGMFTVENAIEDFQKNKGLKRDGRIFPEGPTITQMAKATGVAAPPNSDALLEAEARGEKPHALGQPPPAQPGAEPGLVQPRKPRASDLLAAGPGDRSTPAPPAGSDPISRMLMPDPAGLVGTKTPEPEKGPKKQVAKPKPFTMTAPFDNPTLRDDTIGKGYFHASRVRGKKEYQHKGIDLKAPPGTVIKSPVEGTVERFGDPYGTRKYSVIWIKTEGGRRVGLHYVSPKGKDGKALVKKGDQIKAGQIIGTLQDIGKSKKGMQNHLHLTIRKGSTKGPEIDPTPWLKAWGAAGSKK